MTATNQGSVSVIFDGPVYDGRPAEAVFTVPYEGQFLIQANVVVDPGAYDDNRVGVQRRLTWDPQVDGITTSGGEEWVVWMYPENGITATFVRTVYLAAGTHTFALTVTDKKTGARMAATWRASVIVIGVGGTQQTVQVAREALTLEWQSGNVLTVRGQDGTVRAGSRWSDGVLSPRTWYYVYLTAAAKPQITLSGTPPSEVDFPDRQRYLGAVFTDEAGRFRPFTQVGDRFWLQDSTPDDRFEVRRILQRTGRLRVELLGNRAMGSAGGIIVSEGARPREGDLVQRSYWTRESLRPNTSYGVLLLERSYATLSRGAILRWPVIEEVRGDDVPSVCLCDRIPDGTWERCLYLGSVFTDEGCQFAGLKVEDLAAAAYGTPSWMNVVQDAAAPERPEDAIAPGRRRLRFDGDA